MDGLHLRSTLSAPSAHGEHVSTAADAQNTFLGRLRLRRSRAFIILAIWIAFSLGFVAAALTSAPDNVQARRIDIVLDAWNKFAGNTPFRLRVGEDAADGVAPLPQLALSAHSNGSQETAMPLSSASRSGDGSATESERVSSATAANSPLASGVAPTPSFADLPAHASGATTESTPAPASSTTSTAARVRPPVGVPGSSPCAAYCRYLRRAAGGADKLRIASGAYRVAHAMDFGRNVGDTREIVAGIWAAATTVTAHAPASASESDASIAGMDPCDALPSTECPAWVARLSLLPVDDKPAARDEWGLLRAQQDMYAWQFGPAACDRVVMYPTVLGTGLGSIMTHYAVVLQQSREVFERSTVFAPDGWMYANPATNAACNGRANPSCYLWETSGCEGVVQRPRPEDGPLTIVWRDPMSVARVRASSAQAVYLDWYVKTGAFPAAPPDVVRLPALPWAAEWAAFWYHCQLQYFALQPKPYVSATVDEFRRGFGERWRRPILFAHVRRADKGIEAPLQPSSRYIAEVRRFKQTFGIMSVFLSTDDPAAIEDFRAVSEFGVELLYLPHNLTNQAPYMGLRSGTINQTEETMYLLATIYLAAQCDFWLGTFTSNLGRIAFKLMVATYGAVPHYSSLDAWRDNAGSLPPPLNPLRSF